LHIAQGGVAELRDYSGGTLRVKRGNCGEERFALLADYLEQIGFDKLKPEYRDSLCLDCGEFTLEVERATGTKRVYSEGFDAPSTLWVLYGALTDIKSRVITWHEAR